METEKDAGGVGRNRAGWGDLVPVSLYVPQNREEERDIESRRQWKERRLAGE